MITLTPRLRACADWVTRGGTACDVGTDHAYLPVYLLQAGICPAVTACDIGEGPLEAARQTAARYALSAQITLKLTDGLQGVAPADFTDIIIAGMGGETIAAILGAADWSVPSPQLILQPMTRAAWLRTWLAANGYATLRERAVREGGRIYCVMAVRYTGDKAALTPLNAEVGALDCCDPTARDYVAAQAKRCRKKAVGLHAAGQDAAADEALAAALEQWTREETNDDR